MRWLVLVVLVSGCGQRNAPSPPPAPADAGRSTTVRVDPGLVGHRVVVAPLARRPLRGARVFSAELVPNEVGQAEVGSLASGRVGAIAVKDGERVEAGQILAWIDSPEASRVAAEGIRARARLAAAKRNLDRQLALEADRATSAAAVDMARVEMDSARAEAGATRLLLAGLGLSESDSVAARVPVRSPIAGGIAERSTVLGAAVTPDKTLFRVIATDRVVADVRWSDAAESVPPVGARAEILVRGRDGGTCAATVGAASVMVDDKTRSRRVRVLPTACAGLVAGAYAEVAFDAVDVVGLALPKEAVVDVRGAPTVFVATADAGRFEPRIVELGARSADDVVITKGVAEGERVVTDGAVLVKGELLRAELEP